MRSMSSVCVSTAIEEVLTANATRERVNLDMKTLLRNITRRKARYTKGVGRQCKDNENYSHYLVIV